MILIQNIENKTFRKAIGLEFAKLRRERNQEIEKVAAAVGAYPETVDRLELGYYTAYRLTARLLKYYNKGIKIELVAENRQQKTPENPGFLLLKA